MGEGRIRGVVEHVEERYLACGAVFLTLGGGIDDVGRVGLVHKAHHLLAGVAAGVEGAGLDEGLDDAAPHLGGVHAVHEVMERLEGAASGALLKDHLGRAFAHAADAGQTKAHAFVGGGELGAGLIDVWRQDVDALRAAGADVVDDLLGFARIAGEHGGHVLAGVVGLEPGRLHDEDGVAC